jgi:hypothetical protein
VGRKAKPLAVEQILAWAEAHRARTGRWPRAESGAIRDAPGENWYAVNHALAYGYRGLPGGSSLSQSSPPSGASRTSSANRP